MVYSELEIFWFSLEKDLEVGEIKVLEWICYLNIFIYICEFRNSVI